MKKNIKLEDSKEEEEGLQIVNEKSKQTFDSIIDLSSASEMSILSSNYDRQKAKEKRERSKNQKGIKSEKDISAEIGKFLGNDEVIKEDHNEGDSSEDEKFSNLKGYQEFKKEFDDKIHAFQTIQDDQAGGTVERRQAISLNSTPYTITTNSNMNDTKGML